MINRYFIYLFIYLFYLFLTYKELYLYSVIIWYIFFLHYEESNYE